jgi:hypothetical protein
MKTKKNLDAIITTSEKSLLIKTRPKSLRPMRSMVAVRSLKSSTIAAGVMAQAQEVTQRR